VALWRPLAGAEQAQRFDFKVREDMFAGWTVTPLLSNGR